MSASRRPRAPWLAVALCAAAGLAVSACGGGPGGPTARSMGDTTALQGVSLVVGSQMDDWSLLAVPRAGGKATARAVEDPGRTLWTGSTELPASREVHALEGPVLVLRTSGGAVYRYDPTTDSLGRVGHVGADARWGQWGAYGAYLDPKSGHVLEIGPDGAWDFAVSGEPEWASPVEDGALAVLRSGGSSAGSVWLVNRGDSTPASRTSPGYAGPALTTAWGKRLVLTASGGRSVRVLAVPSLADAEDIGVGGSVSALAASPSSHEIYAALSGPARVVSVNRFSRETRVLTQVDTTLTALRVAVLGQFLLGREGSRVAWIPLGGRRPVTVSADWRQDLPMGTPAGRVLLSRGDSLYSWTPGSGEAPRAIDAPAKDWWSAVRWNPAPPPVRVARADVDSTVPEEVPGAGAAAGGPPADTSTPLAPPPAGAAVAGRTGTDTAHAAGTPAEDSAGIGFHPQPGIYAIVTSARALGGVRKLLSSLSDAGYPTAIQRFLDDAGQTWYRGMVGPYPSRDAAEATARQLRRERSLSVWVTDIRPGSLSPENLR